MDMFTFVTMVNPTIVGIFVMMCATAYAFILAVEAKREEQQQQQQQQPQQQKQQDNDELASQKTYGEWIATLQRKEKENVKTIQKQQEQIDRMEYSLKRIIEGLYDWETQAPVHTHEIELLMGFPLTRKNEFAEMEMEDVCDMNPTTQQGFRLEKRIAALESSLKK